MKKIDFDDLVIYFEGEIYNKNIFSFDDEFLIIEHLYKNFGFNFVSKLDGVFSFCIFDKVKNIYFCARDRFGNIPFFYTIKDDKFIFSSSIREILSQISYIPKINKVALSKYIQYFSTFGEDTFYKDIYKLEEATYLVYEPHKELIKKKYFKINTYKAINDENRALNDLEELFLLLLKNV